VSDVSVQKKILVVEDVADTRKLFALSLTHFGFEVFEAVDGIEGLERTATVHPDLIIMDIRMPRMDGLEAMTRLKADPATRNIPILVATANTDKIEIQTLREAGACDVLIKPIELKILRQKVERHVCGDLAVLPASANRHESNILGL
jgi:CheY-like chemotaxis protein